MQRLKDIAILLGGRSINHPLQSPNHAVEPLDELPLVKGNARAGIVGIVKLTMGERVEEEESGCHSRC